MSVSGVLRKLLDDTISTRRADPTAEDPFVAVIGKYASGHTDTARRSKDILYGRDAR